MKQHEVLSKEAWMREGVHASFILMICFAVGAGLQPQPNFILKKLAEIGCVSELTGLLTRVGGCFTQKAISKT